MGFSSSSIIRRAMLATAAGLSVAGLANNSQAASQSGLAGRKQFPKGFRWGVATAGNQIEGNNTNSDLWLLENIKPTTFVDQSGDACDRYHRHEEDVALLAKLEFNARRLEASRIGRNR